MRTPIKALIVSVTIIIVSICSMKVYDIVQKQLLYDTIKDIKFPFIKHYGTCDIVGGLRDLAR